MLYAVSIQSRKVHTMNRTTKTVIKMTGKTLLAIPPVSEVKELSEKITRKYLSPDGYNEIAEAIPNLIVVVNEAPDRDNEERQGMIGWTENAKKLETLCLYDEFVPKTNLNFIPQIQCDTAYYVHPFNRDTFIRVDDYYEYCMQARLAELYNIAYYLGAKKYSVEMASDSRVYKEKNRSASLKLALKKKMIEKENASLAEEKPPFEYEQACSSETTHHMLARAEFPVAREPRRPELVWFKNDQRLSTVIQNICEGKDTPKEIVLEFYGKQNKTMSTTASASLSATIKKINATLATKIKKEATEEDAHKLVFQLEF